MRNFIREIQIEQSKKAVKVFDHLNTIINLVLSSINTVAGKAIIDVKEKIEGTKYFRHSIKHFSNQAVCYYYKYERAHRKNFEGRDDLFLDYLDKVEENIKKEYNATRLAIWTHFILSKEPEPEIRAKIEFAYQITQVACHLYDLLIDIARRETGYTCDFNQYLYMARLTKPLYFMKRLRDDFVKEICGNILDVGDVKNISENLKAMGTKLIDNEFIEKAGYEAIALHPEYKSEVSDEDWKELENKYKNETIQQKPSQDN